MNDELVSDTRERITDLGLKNSSAKWVEEGSILIAMYGSIGKLAIAAKRLTTNQAIAFTKPDPIDAKYLFYYLLGERRALQGRGSGATQSNISQTIIKAWPFLLAPLPEQHRIVAKIEELLSQLDAGVMALKRARSKLKRYKASVLQAACEGRLVAQDANDEPASVLLKRILAERRAKWEAEVLAKGKDPNKAKYVEPPAPDTAGLPELPRGWCWATISSILAEPMMNGKSVKSSEKGFPVLRLTCLRNGRVDFGEVKLGALTKRQAEWYLVEDGDFFVSRGNGSIKLVGRGGLVDKAESQVAFPDLLIRLRPDPEACHRAFLSAIWDSEVIRGQIERTARTTAGIFKINQQDIGRFCIPLPPLSEQHRIVCEVERRQTIVQLMQSSMEASVGRAARLSQSVLRNAFEGCLVSQDPRDESVESLLERVRAARVLQGSGKREQISGAAPQTRKSR